MFMVRVVFWLTVVALLMPREPDVGLGVPGAGTGLSLGSISAPVSAARAAPYCKDYQAACETGLQIADNLQAAALIGLARVKLEIERQKRQRGHMLKS